MATATEHLFWREEGKLCHEQIEGAFTLTTFVQELAVHIGTITVWNYDMYYTAWYSSGPQGSTPENHNLNLIEEQEVPADIRCMMLLLQGNKL